MHRIVDFLKDRLNDFCLEFFRPVINIPVMEIISGLADFSISAKFCYGNGFQFFLAICSL